MLRFPLRRALIAAAVVVLAAGCATHAQQRAAMEAAMAAGNYEQALAELEKKPQPENVLYLLDRGLLLHYLERYAESNEAFEAAEVRIQDLYTRSISKEAASLLTSDTAIPYDGAPFERTMIHYYRTLNYVHEDDLEDALVECRKANLLLATLADATEGKSTAYKNDAFMQYLTALLYEDAREWNDAWVSLREAESAYAGYASAFGVASPASLGADLRRVAKLLGYREEYEQYRERYPDAPDSSLGENGEVVFFFENGMAPIKAQDDIVLPILKGESDRYSDRAEFAAVVAGRYHERDEHGRWRDRHGRDRGHDDDGDVDLEYLLHIALPRIQPRPPVVRSAEIAVGNATARTVVAQDVAALSRTCFDEAMPKILLKTVLRGITKYLATRTAEKQAGEVGGFLANILTAATERADTRGWITLPNDVQMARVAVPPGKHPVSIRFLDGRGLEVSTVAAGVVDVLPGRRVYVSWRDWD